VSNNISKQTANTQKLNEFKRTKEKWKKQLSSQSSV
jgi:hypothetical protein